MALTFSVTFQHGEEDKIKKDCESIVQARKFASQEFNIPLDQVVLTDLKKGDIIEDDFKLKKPLAIEVLTKKELDEIIKQAEEGEEEDDEVSDSEYNEEGSDGDSDDYDGGSYSG